MASRGGGIGQTTMAEVPFRDDQPAYPRGLPDWVGHRLAADRL